MKTLNNAKSIRNIIGGSFPILIFDEVWARFPKNLKTPKILKLEETLKSKIKEEAGHTNNLKGLKSLKEKYLNAIIENSDASGYEGPSLTGTVSEYREKILEINRKIKLAEESLEKLPSLISEINYNLVEEVVLTCYNTMRESEDELLRVNDELFILFEETDRLKNVKTRLEREKRATTYLINALVGKDVVDLLEEGFD
jgi:uncharacterized protein (DUF342 family)